MIPELERREQVADFLLTQALVDLDNDGLLMELNHDEEIQKDEAYVGFNSPITVASERIVTIELTYILPDAKPSIERDQT